MYNYENTQLKWLYCSHNNLWLDFFLLQYLTFNRIGITKWCICKKYVNSGDWQFDWWWYLIVSWKTSAMYWLFILKERIYLGRLFYFISNLFLIILLNPLKLQSNNFQKCVFICVVVAFIYYWQNKFNKYQFLTIKLKWMTCSSNNKSLWRNFWWALDILPAAVFWAGTVVQQTVSCIWRLPDIRTVSYY